MQVIIGRGAYRINSGRIWLIGFFFFPEFPNYGFFSRNFKSILSMYPHSYCLYGVLFCVCVARSGDNIADLLGARVPTSGKQAMKAVPKAEAKAVAKPVPVVPKAVEVNYLAHL